MSGIDLSEAVIRQNANTKSWQCGEICYRDGSVVSVIRRGEEIQAEVQGSEEQPAIAFYIDGINRFVVNGIG